jgi:hypothetical protein
MNLRFVLTLVLTGCTKAPPEETAVETAPAPPTETATVPCGAAPLAVTLAGPAIEQELKYALERGDIVIWNGPDGGFYLAVDPTVEGTLDPVTVAATVDDVTTGATLDATTEEVTGTATADCAMALPQIKLFPTQSRDEACALDGHSAHLTVSVGPVGGAPTVTETIDGTFRSLYSEHTDTDDPPPCP